MTIRIDVVTLTFIFTALKIFGAIEWTWFWVLSPLWIWTLIVLTVLCLITILHLIGEDKNVSR